MRLSCTLNCQNLFGFLHLHSDSPAFLCFDTEGQQSLRQCQIHFCKIAKRRMSIYFSCGTRSALQSCPHTAKAIGQVPSVLSSLMAPSLLQMLLFVPNLWLASPGQDSLHILSSRVHVWGTLHPGIPMPLQRRKG